MANQAAAAAGRGSDAVEVQKTRTPATEQRKLVAVAIELLKVREILLEIGRAEPPDDAMDEGTVADTVLYRVAVVAESVAWEIVELEARMQTAASVTAADLHKEWRDLQRIQEQ